MASTKKIQSDGTIEWRNEAGDLHRENGPAIEWADGEKWWCKHGKLHRENGPAREYANGTNYWYLNDIRVSEQEHAWRVKHGCMGSIDAMPEKLKMEYLLVFG